MTNDDSLAKMNQGTMIALITFLVWIVFFHSTSCNAFVLGVQAFQSPKMPSKIDFNSFKPAIGEKSQINKEESLILPVPNDGPAFIQLSVPNNGHAQFKQHSVPNDGPA